MEGKREGFSYKAALRTVTEKLGLTRVRKF